MSPVKPGGVYRVRHDVISDPWVAPGSIVRVADIPPNTDQAEDWYVELVFGTIVYHCSVEGLEDLSVCETDELEEI